MKNVGSLQLAGFDYSSDFQKKQISCHRPTGLFFDIIPKCNLNCLFCYSNKGKQAKEQTKKQAALKLENIKKIINEGKNLGIKLVSVCGEGEPLLDVKKTLAVFQYAKENGVTPVLYTNGTRITPKLAKELFDLNVSIIGKLHSIEPAVNSFLTGDKGEYKYVQLNGAKVPSHIKDILQAGYEKTSRFAVNIVVTKKNLPTLKQTWKWAREQGILPYGEFMTYSGCAKKVQHLDLSIEERQKVHEMIWKLDKKLGYNYSKPFGHYLGPRACNAKGDAVFDRYGNLKLCAASYEYLGNIQNRSLASLMEKRARREVALGRTYDKKVPFCECHIYNLKQDKLPCEACHG